MAIIATSEGTYATQKRKAGHGRAVAAGGGQHGLLHRVQDEGGHFRRQARQTASDLAGR